MSVQTEADDRLEDAVNCIHEAVAALTSILILECQGHDEFSEGADNAMWFAFMKLTDIMERNPTFKRYHNRTGRTVSIQPSTRGDEL